MTAWSLEIHFLTSVTTVTSAALIVPSTIIRNEIVCVLWSDSVDLISPGDLLQCRSISVVTRSLTKVKSDSQLTYDHIYSSLRRLTHLSHAHSYDVLLSFYICSLLYETALKSARRVNLCDDIKCHIIRLNLWQVRTLVQGLSLASRQRRWKQMFLSVRVCVCMCVSMDFISSEFSQIRNKLVHLRLIDWLITVTPPLFSVFKNNVQIPLILSITNGALALYVVVSGYVC